MPDTAYDAPRFHDGIWYPTLNTTVRGRLVSVTGVAYEFDPDRPIPHLNLLVPADGILIAPGSDGVYSKVEGGRMIEVHCFPARLLKEVEAVRPREGEDVEISTGAQLVRGFLTYVVSAGGRWSTAEHWAPEDISTYCAFGAHHLKPRAADPTIITRPVERLAKNSTSPADALANATDLIKPSWPGSSVAPPSPADAISGSALFTPEPQA